MPRLAFTIKSLGAISGIILGAVLAVSPATGASVTFKFTGVVGSGQNDIGSKLTPGPFSAGQAVTGFYTFSDTGTAPVISASGTTATYSGRLDGPSTNLNVTFGPGVPAYTASFATGTTNTIEVKNAVAPNQDAYAVKGFFSGDAVGGETADSFLLELNKLPTNTFTSTSLPVTPPSIGSLSAIDKTFRLVFGLGGNSRTVLVNISTLTAVPLPPAVILFGAGLIALVGLGAGSWRKMKNSLA